MRRSRPQHIPSIERALRSEQIGELLRFVRGFDTNSDSEELLRSLPARLCTLVASDTTALIQINEDVLSCYGVDGEMAPASEFAMAQWRDEIRRLNSERPQPIVVSSLDQEIGLSNIGQYFRDLGNQSLCMLPLNTAPHRLGVLCFARKRRYAFSKAEAAFLSLIADYIALAIHDRLNLVHSEAVRAQLESERTKLKLILDLNNSVVSNLELREVLRSVSPSIRKTMRLDGVALILPDAANNNLLQLYALDFPDGKGILHRDMSRPLDRSLAGQVFRSGQPWIGDIEELNGSGFDNRSISGDGVQTLCVLPLIRCNSILGVLGLVRLQKNAFTQTDIEFLSQIAGQVAIAIDNAFAYRQISELKDRLTQEKLYLEDEIRSEMNFEEIIGNSTVLRQVLRQVEAVAPTNSTVLIQGETGTGKELIARAVHNLSQRRSHPFVKLNCAAIPTGLLESELFGHEKGAFTGAIAQRIGRFELASQGTIFLDEISEIFC